MVVIGFSIQFVTQQGKEAPVLDFDTSQIILLCLQPMKLQVTNLWPFAPDPQPPRGCYFFQSSADDSSFFILLPSETRGEFFSK